MHWKDWCWSSNTLATWCKEPTHWKRLWCWERLKARGDGDDIGWDGWMASPTPRAYSNSCPSSQWCGLTISSSVIPFSCLQSYPSTGFFPVSRLFASGSQSIGTSASVRPMNIKYWFPLGLTGLISLQSKRLSRAFSNTTVQKNQFCAQLSL